MSLTFTVYGTPGPQGSKKYMGQSGKGRAILKEVSGKVKPWRAAVVEATVDPLRPALDGPLSVRMVFTLKKPSAAPKRTRTWPCKTPDLSKLARSTEDALTDAGVWADDARVVEYARLAKVFPGEDPEALHVPGVRIQIDQVVE